MKNISDDPNSLFQSNFLELEKIVFGNDKILLSQRKCSRLHKRSKKAVFGLFSHVFFIRETGNLKFRQIAANLTLIKCMFLIYFSRVFTKKNKKFKKKIAN